MKKMQIVIVLGLAAITLISLSACGGAVDPLDGTSWRLIFYRKTQVMADTTITARFENGEINGSAGCNSYFGAYQIDGQKLTTDQLGSTEMFCMEPEGLMEQEAFFLETLGDAQRYELTDGRLMIFRSDGEALTFEPME